MKQKLAIQKLNQLKDQNVKVLTSDYLLLKNTLSYRDVNTVIEKYNLKNIK